MVITFFGHRELFHEEKEIYSLVYANLYELLHTQSDCTVLCGHKGMFDYICEKCTDEIKKLFPYTNKVYVTPYLSENYQYNILNHLNKKFDEVIFPPACEHCPPALAYVKRNEWMTDRADIILFYIVHNYGGAARTLDYARRKNKKIIFIKP